MWGPSIIVTWEAQMGNTNPLLCLQTGSLLITSRVVAPVLALTSLVWKQTASSVALAMCALFVNWVSPMITLNKINSRITMGRLHACIYSRTPVTRTQITRTPPANLNWVSIPLDLTQLFNHFYLVNSNSDNSKTLLTWTKFCFLWLKFTPITHISGSYNSPRMPIEISH